jgi:hypothetical protein
MLPAPSTNGPIGRTAAGRFAAGNKGGPGNPHAKRVAELRAVLLGRIGDQDVQEVVDMLLRKAKGGDIQAAREVLDRALGRSKQGVEMEMSSRSEEPADEFDRTAEMMRCYARLGVPLENWPWFFRQWFENWLSGQQPDRRPADFEEIAGQVRERCMGWRRIDPAEGRNGGDG